MVFLVTYIATSGEKEQMRAYIYMALIREGPERKLRRKTPYLVLQQTWMIGTKT